MKDEEKYRDYDEGDGSAIGAALGMTTVIVFVLIGLFIAFAFCGCTTTKYVPVETVRTEYKDNVREIHTTDSVTDTRFVYVKGDTVIDYRDRVKWKEKTVHDSIYIERTDTIREPYPVERELSRWEKAKMDLGGVAMGGLGVIIIAFVIWLVRILRVKILKD